MARRRRGQSSISFVSSLSATVTASDAGTFSVSNVVRQSQPAFNPTQRVVSADVKNSAGTDFTVFS